MLELPPTARGATRLRSVYRRVAYEVRHPENHKQLVRFLCVGASGYVINTLLFFMLIHWAGVNDDVSFVVAAMLAATSNFFWNRHWTFGAVEDHPGSQALRFYLVSAGVLLFADGIYQVLVHVVGVSWKTAADGLSWIIATPLSFAVQKLWSFKA